jgi:hypothetical protein
MPGDDKRDDTPMHDDPAPPGAPRPRESRVEPQPSGTDAEGRHVRPTGSTTERAGHHVVPFHRRPSVDNTDEAEARTARGD